MVFRTFEQLTSLQGISISVFGMMVKQVKMQTGSWVMLENIRQKIIGKESFEKNYLHPGATRKMYFSGMQLNFSESIS